MATPFWGANSTVHRVVALRPSALCPAPQLAPCKANVLPKIFSARGVLETPPWQALNARLQKNTAATVTRAGGQCLHLRCGGNSSVKATSANDVFDLDAIATLADAAGANTQAKISGFSTNANRMLINLPTANAVTTTLSQLSGQQGVVVQTNSIDSAPLISFGMDGNDGEAATLTLLGVTDGAQCVKRVGLAAGVTRHFDWSNVG